MVAESITFEELTGSQRSIQLSNRALPYRPLAFPGSHRFKKNSYPGNPIATIQVLGPDEDEIEFKGAWKSRYVFADAKLDGFDDLTFFGLTPITAEILVEAFTRMRISGNQIQVSWGPEVRRGIISKFVPNYQRVEDVEWSITFVPSQIGERSLPPLTTPPIPGIELNAALLALLDVASLIPGFFLPNVTTALLAAEIAAQFAAVSMASVVGSISGVPSISTSEFQAVASNAESVRDACDEIKSLCSDLPIEDYIATANVGDVVSAESWRRAFAAAALVLAAAAIRTRESIRARVNDDVIITVVVRDNQTLRDLALRYLGTSDAWVTIADFNGFTSSNVASGTRVKIPRVGFSATGSRASA